MMSLATLADEEGVVKITWKRWGVLLGALHVVWWDCWKKRPCLEIIWRTQNGPGRDKVLVNIG